MNPTLARIRRFSIMIAAVAVSACATHTRPIDVRIPDYSAPTVDSSLSAIPSMTVRVLPFKDARTTLEGEVSAAFGVPMGHVRFERSPAAILGQVVASEIKAAGHAVADGAQGVQIEGIVRDFEAHTETTPLYWDIIGDLGVSLHVSDARGGGQGAPLDYHARCKDRTYVWPSEAVIAGAMSKCINDFASQLRSDGRAAAALREARTGL